jgi:hypothetical protein
LRGEDGSQSDGKKKKSENGEGGRKDCVFLENQGKRHEALAGRTSHLALELERCGVRCSQFGHQFQGIGSR